MEEDTAPYEPASEELPLAWSQKLRLQIPGYRLLTLVSRGGQGTVYKAERDDQSRTPVAIKVLHGGALADESARARMRREATVLESLDDPNIVKVLARGQSLEGHEFLVMEFIQGSSLESFINVNVKAEAIDIVRDLVLFRKICKAVQSAHFAGIAHRDLSPSNIIVDVGGEPHILDFGLARTAFDRFISGGHTAASVTGQFLGKFAYASPEQVRGENVDIRTDVYALGVILFQIVTGGVFPYSIRGNIQDDIETIIRSEPKFPSELVFSRLARADYFDRQSDRPDLSLVTTQIEAVVLKALDKSPENRYQSAGEMGKDLQNLLQGNPIAVSPAHLARKSTGATNGPPVWLVMAASAVFVAMVAWTLVLWW